MSLASAWPRAAARMAGRGWRLSLRQWLLWALFLWGGERQAAGQACWWVLRSSLLYFGFVWVEDVL